MKKIVISSAIVFAAFSAVSAQTAAPAEQMPLALPPVMTTGSSTLDNQIKALRQGYEAQIKSLREEYLSKLKTLVGEKKQMAGTSTRPMGKDVKGLIGSDKRPMPQSKGEPRKGVVEGASAEVPQNENVPQGNAWGFFKKFLGGN